MPNIGYGSNKATRHMLPSGFMKFVVSNVKELELLMMHNRSYAAEIAHNVSAKKRKEVREESAGMGTCLEGYMLHRRFLFLRAQSIFVFGNPSPSPPQIAERAEQLNINLTNGKARLRSQEDE